MSQEERTDAQPFLNEQELNEEIASICKSKAQEFHMLGYEQVTGQEIWDCVSSKYKKEIPPLHRVINDILTLKTTSFMNWLMINAYKG